MVAAGLEIFAEKRLRGRNCATSLGDKAEGPGVNGVRLWPLCVERRRLRDR